MYVARERSIYPQGGLWGLDEEEQRVEDLTQEFNWRLDNQEVDQGFDDVEVKVD